MARLGEPLRGVSPRGAKPCPRWRRLPAGLDRVDAAFNAGSVATKPDLPHTGLRAPYSFFFIGIECEATSVRYYNFAAMPGLLQTETTRKPSSSTTCPAPTMHRCARATDGCTHLSAGAGVIRRQRA
jgi:hypothetical protein